MRDEILFGDDTIKENYKRHQIMMENNHTKLRCPSEFNKNNDATTYIVQSKSGDRGRAVVTLSDMFHTVSVDENTCAAEEASEKLKNPNKPKVNPHLLEHHHKY